MANTKTNTNKSQPILLHLLYRGCKADIIVILTP